MRKNKICSLFLSVCLFLSVIAAIPINASANTQYPRVMEKLDRGLLAIPKNYGDETSGMFLSWRLLGTESLESTTFDIYKNGSILVSGYNGTSYTDTTNPSGSDTNSVYYVVKSGEGITNSDIPANTIIVNGNQVKLTMTGGYENSSSSKNNAYGYFDIPLNVPASVTDSTVGTYTYSANDCSVGDVDGDGQYEIVVKWDPSNSKDNADTGYTGKVLFSCYELNGTELWQQPIDLGYNIRAGAHYTQFIVYDLDCDGKAEIVMKTAPGSKDAAGNYVTTVGNTSAIKSADNTADYRTSGGYIISGPEYLTVFSGATGKALQTIEYTPLYSVASWGDTYGNRGNRFLAAVGYFGATDKFGNLKPSVVMCRGYYTQVYVVAYDWDGTTLTQRFYYKGTSSGASSLYGQGNHNLAVSDVDNDGYDEIVYGSAVLDHSGTVLSNTQLGHGDALHVSDFNNDGQQEVFQVHEESTGYTSYGGDFRVASTGSHYFGLAASSDVGRGVMDNIDDDYASKNSNALALGWTSATSYTYNLSGSAVAAQPTTSSRTMTNSLVYWDGDLGRELLDDAILAKYDASSGGTSRFYFDKYGYMPISTNNGTKYNACITADILGDWREEIIGRYGTSLRVYISALSTNYKLTTLMHDSQYRSGVAAENVGYNQPPHTSYYIGSASLASSTSNYLAPAYSYTLVTVPNTYTFDFGNGSVQNGYIAVTSSNTYSSSLGYGFTTSVQSAMSRAPSSIPAGYENLYSDQINSTDYSDMKFAVDLANGTYDVVIYYGSWNTGFGTKFTVEGTSSGNLSSVTATTYKTTATVTDGQLNIVISKGSKSYGGYISGIKISAK
ncbi:MAG: rhamnogalacturonan lyase [Clostridia bacterium]|nr:rhamnogalacturonan lyase [Clostridia bacterium]